MQFFPKDEHGELHRLLHCPSTILYMSPLLEGFVIFESEPTTVLRILSKLGLKLGFEDPDIMGRAAC